MPVVWARFIEQETQGSNREVAVKVLRADLAADHALVTRFAREARALASLNHPNVAQIYGLEDSGNTPAFVMELVPGETLSSLLRSQRLTLIDGGKVKAIPGIIGDWGKYVSPGYVLYVDERSVLQALPFDATHLEARGPAFPLLENIESFDISRTGTLICKRSRPKGGTLRWFDKTGKTEAILEAPASYGAPRVSPDGKRLAYTIRGDKGKQIWIYDLVRHVASQLTFENPTTRYPLWMPGGKYLLFLGAQGLFVVTANGSSKPSSS